MMMRTLGRGPVGVGGAAATPASGAGAVGVRPGRGRVGGRRGAVAALAVVVLAVARDLLGRRVDRGVAVVAVGAAEERREAIAVAIRQALQHRDEGPRRQAVLGHRPRHARRRLAAQGHQAQAQGHRQAAGDQPGAGRDALAEPGERAVGQGGEEEREERQEGDLGDRAHRQRVVVETGAVELGPGEAQADHRGQADGDREPRDRQARQPRDHRGRDAADRHDHHPRRRPPGASPAGP
jgi:hypothetical protein